MKKLLNMIVCLLVVFSARAVILHVPADYPSIQEGINAAANGDTVLVDPGTYVENINYNGKYITVASLFLTTQNKAYIAQTIIDGNQAGSVVTINSYYYNEQPTLLCGFTIQNGLAQGEGGGVYIDYESYPILENLVIKNNSATSGWGSSGGGIYCYYYSNPVLKNILITENSADYGGGIFLYYSNPEMENVTITNNTATYGGGIYFSYNSNPVFDPVHSCSIYQNNASYGSDLYNSESYQNISIVLNKFTVKQPKSAQAYPLAGFTFDILQGVFPQDEVLLYVSPTGDNNSNGLSVSQPMKTIHHALEVVNDDPIDLYDIYLLNGTYSPETNGEVFPLDLPDYMGLYGESEEGVILDADSSATVILIYEKAFVEVSGMTIREGLSSGGSGLNIYNSDPVLSYLSIKNNHTYGYWGEGSGGGIYCYAGNPVLKKVTVADNTATYGGGIYFYYSSPVFDSVFRCSIYGNIAESGSDLYNDYNPIHVVVDTFTVLYPKSIHAYPLSNFEFDILNGKVAQENKVLYASPQGDDNNSGLSESQALKTIHQALGIANSDPINLYDIHLADGTYSPSATGEVFPVSITDYVGLFGESRNGTILDAEGQSRVIEMNQSGSVEISNLTITGGATGEYYYEGGGIYCSNSNPFIHEVNILDNYGYYGGGMYCLDNSRPKLENVTISGNSSDDYGGGMYLYNCKPVLKNVLISDNSSMYNGGGIYMYYSSPKLENVTITGNSSQTGGGIYFGYNYNSTVKFDTVNRCNIYLNIASTGSDLYAQYFTEMALDTFTVLKPTRFTAAPIENFSFDILHGKLPQAEADLYVSPDGDDMNSGLTPDEPIRTIRSAMVRIWADSLNPRIINLMEGTYSPSVTGEPFPVAFLDYVSLKGAGRYASILDAEDTAGVMIISDIRGLTILDMTIQGGNSGSYGGGIYISNADPLLSNLEIRDNNASYDYNYGGGIFCQYSNPVLQDVVLTENHAYYGGGLCVGYESNPILNNVMISGNNANSGGGLYCSYYSGGIFKNMSITGNIAASYGGGICFEQSSPEVENALVSENTADNAGGIYFYYSNPVLKNVTVSENSADNTGGGMYADNSYPVFDTASRCNIYLNNALTGKDLYSSNAMQVVVDTFTVLHPKLRHAYPLRNFSFDILHGLIPQQDVVLYASPEGDDNNSGYSEDSPLKTISHAIEISKSDSVNLFTIRLKNGIYSPSKTGETFPVSFLDFGNLIGESMGGVILDAEGLSELIHLESTSFGEISNLTITGGHASENGGGIYCSNSNALFKNLNVDGNESNYGGGGIFLNNSNAVFKSVKITNNQSEFGGGVYCSSSEPTFGNLIITGNSVTGSGGGIYMYDSDPNIQNTYIVSNYAGQGGGISCDYSNPVFQGTSIFDNSANYGGGISFTYLSNPTFDSINRCNIYMNYAERGNDLYAANDYDNETIHIVVDTFSVLYPSTLFAEPLSRFTFDILHGKIESADADLFVSPNGDNSNSGLTENDPLKTIRFAMLKIYADSEHPHTIRLMEGTYSPSLTNEIFPLTIIDYVSLSGAGAGKTILDAEGKSKVINLSSGKGIALSNLDITGGNGESGGGIYCEWTDLVLENMSLYGNYATEGGGIYNVLSNPVYKNVLFYENEAIKGNAIYCVNSDPTLINTTLVGNDSENDYSGGIFLCGGSDAKIINSLLWDNEPHEIMLQGVYDPNSVEVSYSDIMNGENGIFVNGVGTVNWLEGNINEDPVFVGTGEHPFQVSDLSPCIDAGTPDTSGLNLPEYDLAGFMRIDNNRLDMGAYEWNIMVGLSENAAKSIEITVCPNPFRNITTIKYSLEADFPVSLVIYNHLGKQLVTLVNENQLKGDYEITWKANGLPAGVYYFRLVAGKRASNGKMIVLK